jgi:hypothetical protein
MDLHVGDRFKAEGFEWEGADHPDCARRVQILAVAGNQ